jgi:biopolymer transport protein ExbB
MELLNQYLDISIFSILGVMSVVSVALCIERLLFYRSVSLRRYRDLEQLKLDCGKGLSIVATIASNAPYVGLLGTVFGIMLTFHDMGQSGQIDTTSVMSGLALALKATALGLIVAIPSMIFYNGLVAKTEQLIALWKIDDRRARESWHRRQHEEI